MRSLFVILAVVLTIGVEKANADFNLSLDSSQLVVVASGGVVFHDIDLFIEHDGTGEDTFSSYDLEISPADSAIGMSVGDVVDSLFDFDFGHAVAGTGPFLVTGASTTDLIVPAAPTLLARLTFEIDTDAAPLGDIDLGLRVTSATRGGVLGDTIIDEVSASPAILTVVAVPEPTGISLLALLFGVGFARRRAR